MTSNLGVIASSQPTGGAAYDPIGECPVTVAAGWWADDPDWSNPGDGNAIVSWLDGSGNGYPLTPDAGTTPTFDAVASPLNDRAAVDFASSGGRLSNTSLTGLTQAGAVIAVFTNLDAKGSVIDGLTASNKRWLLRKNTVALEGYAGTILQHASAGGDTAAHLAVVEFNGTSGKIRVDGVTTTGTIGTQNPSAGVGMGRIYNGSGSWELHGKVALAIVLDSTILADAGFAAWEATLAAYYGITLP